jgi:hypothetical protein
MVVLIAVMGHRRSGWFSRDPFARFDRLVAEVCRSNEAYFRSLDQMLDALESLRTRAQEAERRLGEMAVRTPEEPREPYEAGTAPTDDDEGVTGEADAVSEPRTRRRERQQAVESDEADATMAPIRTRRPRLAAGAKSAAHFLSLDGKRVRLSGTED